MIWKHLKFSVARRKLPTFPESVGVCGKLMQNRSWTHTDECGYRSKRHKTQNYLECPRAAVLYLAPSSHWNTQDCKKTAQINNSLGHLDRQVKLERGQLFISTILGEKKRPRCIPLYSSFWKAFQGFEFPKSPIVPWLHWLLVQRVQWYNWYKNLLCNMGCIQT